MTHALHARRRLPARHWAIYAATTVAVLGAAVIAPLTLGSASQAETLASAETTSVSESSEASTGSEVSDSSAPTAASERHFPAQSPANDAANTAGKTADTAPTPASASTVASNLQTLTNSLPTIVNWQAPGGTQPNLKDFSNISVDVDLAAQKVYVKSNSAVIYTMIASSGVNDRTPHGDFTIASRGKSFYNPRESMGAKWWTAFLGTKYLFHSVPTDSKGNYIESEARKLGSPASHGCVRLTVADAQWFYDQVPSGTHVHIH